MTADLIARLEAAEVGSRELDALIWLRFNRPEYSGGVKALEMRGWYDGRGHMILETDTGEEVADDLGIGNYTTSLDAALALAERVLGEDQALEILADEARAAHEDTINGCLKRVPIDVCINAILRAKQGEGE
ncbi:hypothetical protein [Brevundimonas sanguinis]|uniref:hypothetical protein n=1 Tax=Brevundimonas sanguinis TaxID=3021811 RepID=UPI00241532F7|nr:hypothetical protein [Brevundimonas sp. NCCP 15609]